MNPQTPTPQDYLAGYFAGMKEAVFNDNIVTSLALGACAVGVAHRPASGVASFFLGYALSRTINSIANAVGNGLIHHSQAVDRLAAPPSYDDRLHAQLS